MLDAALQSGVASRRSCFEVFARRLPPGRGYGVVAGPGTPGQAAGRLPLRGRRSRVSRRPGPLQRRACWSTSPRSGSTAMPGATERAISTCPAARCCGWTPRSARRCWWRRSCCRCSIMTALSLQPRHGCTTQRRSDAISSKWAAAAPTNSPPWPQRERPGWSASMPPPIWLAGARGSTFPTAGTAAHMPSRWRITTRKQRSRRRCARTASRPRCSSTPIDLRTGLERGLAAAKRLGGVPGAVRIDSGDLTVEVPRVRGVARQCRRRVDSHRGVGRPRRVPHRRPGGPAGRRLRRRHPARCGLGTRHRRHGVQGSGHCPILRHVRARHPGAEGHRRARPRVAAWCGRTGWCATAKPCPRRWWSRTAQALRTAGRCTYRYVRDWSCCVPLLPQRRIGSLSSASSRAKCRADDAQTRTALRRSKPKSPPNPDLN